MAEKSAKYCPPLLDEKTAERLEATAARRLARAAERASAPADGPPKPGSFICTTMCEGKYAHTIEMTHLLWTVILPNGLPLPEKKCALPPFRSDFIFNHNRHVYEEYLHIAEAFTLLVPNIVNKLKCEFVRDEGVKTAFSLDFPNTACAMIDPQYDITEKLLTDHHFEHLKIIAEKTPLRYEQVIRRFPTLDPRDACIGALWGKRVDIAISVIEPVAHDKSLCALFKPDWQTSAIQALYNCRAVDAAHVLYLFRLFRIPKGVVMKTVPFYSPHIKLTSTLLHIYKITYDDSRDRFTYHADACLEFWKHVALGAPRICYAVCKKLGVPSFEELEKIEYPWLDCIKKGKKPSDEMLCATDYSTKALLRALRAAAATAELYEMREYITSPKPKRKYVAPPKRAMSPVVISSSDDNSSSEESDDSAAAAPPDAKRRPRHNCMPGSY